MSKDCSLRVPESGPDYNIITVNDSRVCISAADCPDRLCIKRGMIQRAGESVICLPHKLSVSIVSETDDTDGKHDDSGTDSKLIDGVSG